MASHLAHTLNTFERHINKHKINYVLTIMYEQVHELFNIS